MGAKEPLELIFFPKKNKELIFKFKKLVQFYAICGTIVEKEKMNMCVHIYIHTEHGLWLPMLHPEMLKNSIQKAIQTAFLYQ